MNDMLDRLDAGQYVSPLVRDEDGCSTITIEDFLDTISERHLPLCAAINRRLGLAVDSRPSATVATFAIRLRSPGKPKGAHVDADLVWQGSTAAPDRLLAKIAKACRLGEAVPAQVRTEAGLQPLGVWLRRVANSRGIELAAEAATELGCDEATVAGAATMVLGRLAQAGVLA